MLKDDGAQLINLFIKSNLVLIKTDFLLVQAHLMN